MTVLLLALTLTAHIPDHVAVSAIGTTGSYLLLAKVCHVDRRIALPVAMLTTAAAGVAWEAYWHRRNGTEFGWSDLACNAAGIVAGVGVTVGIDRILRRTR
jgi:uncharacterized protein YfiM (DUF2279 family)